MRQFIILWFIAMIITSVSPLRLSAQTAAGDTKKQEQQKAVQESKDLNANGIDDDKEQQKNQKRLNNKTTDRFIDRNGDGICDSREQGLGFRRGNGRTALQTGKRQQGRHQ